jgi:hypothetical protein
MAYLDNRPPIQWMIDTLANVPATVLTKFDPDGDNTYPLFQQLLAASTAWAEDRASTKLNPQQFTMGNPELYDGNGTNQIVMRKRPALSVQLLQVVTPILGYIRVYQQDEIKLYIKQGVIKVFTYKLAVEQALLQTVDYQAWGSLFPPLPQCVQVAYTYGFPQYDPVANLTTYDMGITTQAGDQRDPELVNWLTNLQQAIVCDACASFLAQSAGLLAGLVTSVSFDGYSRGVNPQAFGAQVQALVQKRDELMGRRARSFYMTTLGSTSY